MNYFSGKSDYKDAVRKILDSISANKNVIDDISKIVSQTEDINSVTADKIIKLGYIQTQITKMVDSKNGELDETELENQLKTILIKSWSDLSNKAVDKAKKDLK